MLTLSTHDVRAVLNLSKGGVFNRFFSPEADGLANLMKVEEQIKKAVAQKIRASVEITVHDMYIWLEGYLAGIGKDDTNTYLLGSKIIQDAFNAG